MKNLFLTIFLILSSPAAWQTSWASTHKSLGRIEVRVGDKTSYFEFFSDKSYKAQRGQEKIHSGKLNEKNFKYYSREFKKASKLKSFPVQACSREMLSLQTGGKKIESCISAKNPTAKGLTELSNRVRFLM